MILCADDSVLLYRDKNIQNFKTKTESVFQQIENRINLSDFP